MVALSEPGAATKLLEPLPARTTRQPEGNTLTAQAIPVAPTAKQSLIVHSVELENGSGFYVTGAAAPGTKLRVYLNNSPLTEVAAASNGTWSVKIRRGLIGGHYIVRADGSPDGRMVTARAEVPFDVPFAMADAVSGGQVPPGAAAAVAPARPLRSLAETMPQKNLSTLLPLSQASPVREASGAYPAVTDAVIDEISTASVRAGDNLWDISRVRLGQGRRYTRIFAANAAQIRDPRLIYPGQIFVLPGGGE